MNYRNRLRIYAFYPDGIPCACRVCTMRRLLKERDKRHVASRKTHQEGTQRHDEQRRN